MTDASNTSTRCAACDYDLRGTLSADGALCPECAQPVSGVSVAIARERMFFRSLRRLLVIVFAITALLGAGAVAMFRDHALFVTPLLFLLIAPVAPVLIAAYCVRRLG